MSDLEKQDLQNKILELESYVKETKQNIAKAEENIKQCEKVIKSLKDIAWDRQSKKESSQMYKVLKEDKTHTMVKSKVGDIRVDKDFMDKEIQKHLDNPNLRGMVTTQEMLSFPKVAKNVEAEFEERYQGYSWKAKANDNNIINYGERDYGKGSRLLTVHSKTGRGERGQLHQEFNDRNFHNPVKESIPQTNPQSQANSQEAEFAKLRAEVRKASATLNKDTPNENLGKDIEK